MGIFNLFNKDVIVEHKSPNEIDSNFKNSFKYPIRYNSTSPGKTFNINDFEKNFFNYLHSTLNKHENNKINLVRVSNGELTVYYSTYPVGRIKLQGKKYYMQVLYDLYEHERIEGNIDDFIPKIYIWVIYIRKYLKNSY